MKCWFTTQINGINAECKLQPGHGGNCDFAVPDPNPHASVRRAFIEISSALEHLTATERRRVILAACLIHDVDL